MLHRLLPCHRQTVFQFALLLTYMFVLVLPAPNVHAADVVATTIREKIDAFDTAVMNGNPQSAMQQFNMTREKFGEHPLILTWHGKIQMMQRNAAEAIQYFNLALAKDPDQPLATALLATIEIQTGKSTEGVKRVEQALTKHPDAPELLQIQAELKMLQMDAAGALPIWQKIAGNEKNSVLLRANAYSKIGEIHIKNAEHDQAAQALGQALELNWHPNVAFAHIAELYKADKLPEAAKAYEAFKKKLDADPRLAQFKTQTLTQLKPLEDDLELGGLPEKLSEARFNYFSFDLILKRLRKAYEGKSDEASLKKLRMLDEYAVDAKTRQINDMISKNNGTMSWRVARAIELEELAAKIDGPKAETAIAYAQKIQADANQRDQEMVIEAMALAKSGWKLTDFVYPSDEKREILKQKNLPEKLTGMHSAMGKALAEYYQVLADQQQRPAYEPLVLEFIKNPDDAQLKAKLANMFYEHVSKINPESEDISQEVLPDIFWASIPNPSTSPAIGKELEDKADMSYSLWNNFKVTDPMAAHRWKDLIDGYTRIINVYPRYSALIGRAKVHFYAGDYQQAFEDMAVSVAVKAYERAHTFSKLSSLTHDWGWVANGLIQMHEMHDVMTGKATTTGKHPTAAFVEAAQNIREKKWAELGPFLTMEHDKSSFAYTMLHDMKWGPRLYRVDILNALTDKYVQNQDNKQVCEEIVKQADALYADQHPAFGFLKITKEMSDEDAIKRLEAIARTPELGGTYDPSINYLLAAMYEKRGDKELALLQFNAGATGWDVKENVDTFYNKCAQKRDALETTTDRKELFTRYGDLHKDFKERSKDFGNDILELYRWEGILNRLWVLNAKKTWVMHQRHPIRQKLMNFQGAIDDLKYVLEHDETTKKDVVAALLGHNYHEMGDYENAIAEYSKAIGLGYEKTWIFNARASLYRSAGKAEKAVEDYTQTLKLEPENETALENRAELNEWYLKNYEAALKDLEKQREVRIAKRAKDKKTDPLTNYLYSTDVIDFSIANLKMKIAQNNLKSMFGN